MNRIIIKDVDSNYKYYYKNIYKVITMSKHITKYQLCRVKVQYLLHNIIYYYKITYYNINYYIMKKRVIRMD